MVANDRGFTVVEVIVAIVVVTVGLLGLLSTTGKTTGMVSRGDRAATASLYSHERLERLRAVGCDALNNGSEVRGGHYDMAWTVSVVAGGQARRIELVTTYPTGPATRADTFQTAIPCG